MSNFEPDGPSENEWEDRGELAWNEFDWEHYLRDQEDVIHRYLAFYEQLRDHPDRIDEVAHLMRWDRDEWSSDSASDEEEEDGSYSSEPAVDEKAEANEYDAEPYTLHKNPIFITTKAIYLSLKRGWERIAGDADKVPQSLALALQTSLYRGEEHALLAIQALDFGDYAMATSLFKRALRELNQSFSLLDERCAAISRSLTHFRGDALPRLFDLRETWLRVMNECREELDRSGDDSDGEV